MVRSLATVSRANSPRLGVRRYGTDTLPSTGAPRFQRVLVCGAGAHLALYSRAMTHRFVVLLALVAGCKEKVLAKVNCEVVEGPAVDCTVTETEGKTEIEVCWDFGVRCESGATLDAPRACVTVRDGETEKKNIPMDKIKVTGRCSGT